MEHLTLTNIVLALCGLMLYALFKFNKRKEKTSFSISYWFKNNWVDALMASVSTVAIMLMLDEICSIFTIGSVDGAHTFEKCSSFLGGLFNYAIVDRLKNKFFGGNDNSTPPATEI